MRAQRRLWRTPVVPPLNRRIAGSSSASGTAGRGAPACSRIRSCHAQVARLQLDAVALLLLLSEGEQQAQVSPGRYSLMFVAMTRRTCVRACSAFSLS